MLIKSLKSYLKSFKVQENEMLDILLNLKLVLLFSKVAVVAWIIFSKNPEGYNQLKFNDRLRVVIFNKPDGITINEDKKFKLFRFKWRLFLFLFVTVVIVNLLIIFLTRN